MDQTSLLRLSLNAIFPEKCIVSSKRTASLRCSKGPTAFRHDLHAQPFFQSCWQSHSLRIAGRQKEAYRKNEEKRKNLTKKSPRTFYASEMCRRMPNARFRATPMIQKTKT
jgi:hypothetical protein